MPASAIEDQRKLLELERAQWYRECRSSFINFCIEALSARGESPALHRRLIALTPSATRWRPNPKDAESETARGTTYDWFVNDLQTRLTSDGAIILITTAFHEDDLAGRLPRIQQRESHIFRLPAIADEDDDPFGRKSVNRCGPMISTVTAPGCWSWNRRPFVRAAAAIGLRNIRSSPPKTPIFDALPDAKVVSRVRGRDLAASSGRGEWTAGMKLVRLCGDPRFQDLMIITDVQRIRGAPEDVRHLVRTVAAVDGSAAKQLFPGDRGQAGGRPGGILRDDVAGTAGDSGATDRLQGYPR